MRAIKLPKGLEPLLEAAEASKEDAVVFTHRKKPVAALVSLRNVDRECLALGTSHEFAEIIESARREIREGRTVSLEQLEADLALPIVQKQMKQSSTRRRSNSKR